MKSIAVMNQKGGTGKTTSVLNIAGELALRELKVLIIDVDTQGNATSNIEIVQDSEYSLSDAILDKNIPLSYTICKTAIQNIDIIKGGSLLAPALNALNEMILGRDTVLKRLMKTIPDGYDFVIFDCSPSLESLLNINVLVAAKYVLIPIKVDKNSIEGYDNMLETIQNVREIANEDIKALGIFMTAVEPNATLDKEMIENFTTVLPNLALETYIHKNIDIKKAPIAQLPLCFFNNRCSAAKDYSKLTEEILCRISEDS